MCTEPPQQYVIGYCSEEKIVWPFISALLAFAEFLSHIEVFGAELFGYEKW